jgi:hypothetical protein
MKLHLVVVELVILFLVSFIPLCFAIEMSLTYDANGNLITGDGKYRVYNSFNQLWKVYNGSNATLLLEEYTYHPVEERVWVKKSYNMSGALVETVYYINQYRVIIQNLTGTYNYTYVYHEGQLIAQINPDGNKIYMHTDLKGDVVVTTNSTGSVIERTSYSPTGEVLTGGRQSRFSYEGKESDASLGYVPLGGLVSYYSFNDGTSDEATGNNGVAVNATRTSSGMIRDAYAFDGVSDYIVINDSASLDINSSITLSAWVYPVKNAQGYIVAKYGSYMIQFTGTTFQGGIWNSGGSWNALTTSTGTIPLNTWTQVTFTYNRSNAYLYVNGAVNASGTSTNYINVTNNELMIGAKSPTIRDRDFNGTIDEVGIWNRAISSSEAKTLYDYGRNYDENAATDFHFRMYNPYTYTQSVPDPFIPNVYSSQGLNRYSFEGNSPYNHVDPTGHFNYFLDFINKVKEQFDKAVSNLDDAFSDMYNKATDSFKTNTPVDDFTRVGYDMTIGPFVDVGRYGAEEAYFQTTKNLGSENRKSSINNYIDSRRTDVKYSAVSILTDQISTVATTTAKVTKNVFIKGFSNALNTFKYSSKSYTAVTHGDLPKDIIENNIKGPWFMSYIDNGNYNQEDSSTCKATFDTADMTKR